MENSRKDFLKKICISGACMCGFSAIAASAANISQTGDSSEDQNNNLPMIQDWISTLLTTMEHEVDEKTIRKILKNCSSVHFNQLNLDKLLAGYVGDLEGFIHALEEKFGWKIDYDKESKTILVNENKDYCVCPMANLKKGGMSAMLCYCSEGFAEKLFSTVTQVPMTASVVSSVQKGDKRCIYKITPNE